MHDQLKLEPLELNDFWGDQRASRHPVEGTVARGQLDTDVHLHLGRWPGGQRSIAMNDKGADQAGTGQADTEQAGTDQPAALFDPGLVDTFPFPVDRAVLERGRERYDIYCAPCHAQTGDGDGMVVRRGYRRPPSLHTDRLQSAPVGHLYDVIRRGYGAMPAYATMVPVRDRWSIVAYIRALQLSANASLSDVPESERAALMAQPPSAEETPQ